MQRTTDPRSSMTATGVLPSHSKWLWVGPDHMLFLTSMDSSPLGTLVCLWQNPLLPLPQPALPAYCARSPMWVFSQACFGPTWAWNLLLSSFSPASYLGLSLQPCFLGLLNSFKFFCTSLCNAGSSWKHSSLPSIFPGLSQLKTPPPESLPVFLVWWAGDACSWAPTAALGHGAFHPGCCLHSVLFVSPWSVEFSSSPGPRPGRVPYCQMVILKSAYFQPSCQLWGGNTSRTRGNKRPGFRRWAMGASRISVDCRRGRGWGVDFGPTAWANMGWQLWTHWAHQPG